MNHAMSNRPSRPAGLAAKRALDIVVALSGLVLAAPVMLLIALAVALHLTAGGRVLAWTVAALVLYGATLLITMRCNVPLNDRLDAAGPVDRIADLAAVRESFEATWVRWNLVPARRLIGSGSARWRCPGWVGRRDVGDTESINRAGLKRREGGTGTK